MRSVSGEPGTSPTTTSAVFLVRAWLEDDDQFRARITYLSDVTRGPLGQTEVYVADTDGVHRQLAAWLQVLHPGPSETRPSRPD